MPDVQHPDVRSLVSELPVPVTDLTCEVMDLVRSACPEWMYNHSIRTYVFAEHFGRCDGVEFDPELLYLSAMLHDLGATPTGEGDGRFEADGADFARSFLLERGVREDWAHVVWDAVALHGSIGLADRHPSPEVRLVYHGVWLDTVGQRARDLADDVVAPVFQRYPRLGCVQHAIETNLDQARRDWRKAPPFTLQAALAERFIEGFPHLDIGAMLGEDYWRAYP